MVSFRSIISPYPGVMKSVDYLRSQSFPIMSIWNFNLYHFIFLIEDDSQILLRIAWRFSISLQVLASAITLKSQTYFRIPQMLCHFSTTRGFHLYVKISSYWNSMYVISLFKHCGIPWILFDLSEYTQAQAVDQNACAIIFKSSHTSQISSLSDITIFVSGS